MKRHLAIVSTYFQLMVVCNIALEDKQYKADIWDICITDFSLESKRISARLKETNVFRNVYYAEIKSVAYKDNYLKRTLRAFLGKHAIKDILPDVYRNSYDYLWLYNINIFSYSIFHTVKMNNKNLIVNRYEEGYASYLSDTVPKKLSMLMNIKYIFSNKYNLLKNIDSYYFFNKDLLKWRPKSKIMEMKKFNRNSKRMMNILTSLFDVEDAIKEYDKKYIFFEESFSCRSYEIDDVELVRLIAKIVGKENVIIKRHPRVECNRFKTEGIKVNCVTNIPWEAIRFVCDFDDKVFLSITSGSVLSSSLYFADNSISYLLFNCTKKMSDMVNDQYLEYIKDIKNQGMIMIPQSVEEFKDKLQRNAMQI